MKPSFDPFLKGNGKHTGDKGASKATSGGYKGKGSMGKPSKNGCKSRLGR
jgi:hypothetical protein